MYDKWVDWERIHFVMLCLSHSLYWKAPRYVARVIWWFACARWRPHHGHQTQSINRANHKRKLATIFVQPWTNGIHGEIYWFSLTCEEQKYNRERQFLWKRDGVTQTKRLIPRLVSPANTNTFLVSNWEKIDRVIHQHFWEPVRKAFTKEIAWLLSEVISKTALKTGIFCFALKELLLLPINRVITSTTNNHLSKRFRLQEAILFHSGSSGETSFRCKSSLRVSQSVLSKFAVSQRAS